MNQTSFAPGGLKYWRRIYDSLVSSGWKSIAESWDEEIESLLFANSTSLGCPPCSGLHLEEDTDHCLHCEELLQLSLFSILLSQATQDKQCLDLFKHLLKKHCLCQKLIDRIYASSVYISHVAGKVFVSLISLNPFKYFTKNGFGEMVLSFIDHPQSHTHTSRGFLVLKNILRTKLPKDVNAAYVSALISSWTIIIAAFKEHITDSRCNLAFLTFWWKLFKNINKNSTNPELAFYKSQMTNYFFLELDYLCEIFQSSWTDNEHLYKTSLKLFCSVLNYETDLSVQKDIPVVYHNVCAKLLQNRSFSQKAFAASVLKSNHPVRIGGSNIQIHENPNVDWDKNWKKIETGSVHSPLNMSLLRKLILLEFNVCTIALRSAYFKDHSSESEDINVQLLEKILLKLQQMCLFIHHNLQSKSPPTEKQVIDWLPEVFADQDNCWIQVLLAVTDLYVINKMRYEENATAKRISTLINPHLMFQQFLESLAYDSSVLLDLLTSPETCFLLFFLKYLKLLSKEWHLFKEFHEGTHMDSRNTTASIFFNVNASDLVGDTGLPKRSTSRTMKMDSITTEKNSIVDCEVKSEDYHSLSSSHTMENVKSSFESDTDEENDETIDCKVYHSQNAPINDPYKNDDHCTIGHSESISCGIGTKQHFTMETLNSVSECPTIDCNFEKDAPCSHVHENQNQIQPTQFPNLKPCFKDSQNDKDVSFLSKIEKKQADDDKMEVENKISKSIPVKGIGLASIQMYSDNSSNSEDEEDKHFDNTIEERQTSHNLSSSVSKDASDTEEQFSNFKYGENENEKGQAERDTFQTTRRHHQQFRNTFISSNSNVPKVASSHSTLDNAMLCLDRLLQLLKRLSKSSVFPYSSKPLINALEACVSLYET